MSKSDTKEEKKMKYRLKKRLYFNIHIGFYFSYSVICREEKIEIRDAFPDKRKATEFISLINSLDLHPVHLKDALEDFIS